MTGPDVETVEKLKQFRQCAEPFAPVLEHGLGAVKEGLLAGRSFIDAWITIIDQLQACPKGAPADDADARKVEVT